MPIPNMISKMHPVLRILDQAVQRLHDLGQVGPPIIRIKVEIKGIHLVGTLFDENHDTRSRVGRLARLIWHVTQQPGRQRGHVIVGRERHGNGPPIVQEREVVQRHGWQIWQGLEVDHGSRMADVGEQIRWSEGVE